jgi:hypothetical protein
MRCLLLVSIAVISLVWVPGAWAQSHKITESELTKLLGDAAVKRTGRPYRIHVRQWTEGEPNSASEGIWEYGLKSTMHYRLVSGGTSDTWLEAIWIGSQAYRRQRDGKWIKLPWQAPSDPAKTALGSLFRTGDPSELTVECLYVGGEMVHGQPASHYRKTELLKFISGTPITVKKVQDDWINAGGLLVKESYVSNEEDLKKQVIRVSDYEDNVDIKITAPIPD